MGARTGVVGAGLCAWLSMVVGCRGDALPAAGPVRRLDAATPGVPDASAPVADAGRADAGPATPPPPPPGLPAGVDGGLPSGVCAPPPDGLARPLAPISGSTVTSARPLLHVAPVAGSPTRAQICADRYCANVLWEGTSDTAELTPTVDLPPGYWYWRVEATGAQNVIWSPSWLLRVRRRAPGYAPLANTAVEPFADYDGDGYPDAVVYTTKISIYLGGADGLSAGRLVVADGSAASAGSPGAPGSDLNGDGYTDFATFHLLLNQQDAWDSQEVGLIQFGVVGGLTTIAGEVTLALTDSLVSIDHPIGIGDFDGDGFGDLFWPVRYGSFVFRGCYGGPAAGPWIAIDDCATCGDTTTMTGDFDGDGVFDLVYTDPSSLTVHPGGSGPPPAFPLPGASGGVVVDANYDGYSDLLTHLPNEGTGLYLFAGGPNGLARQPSGDPLPIAPDAVGDFDGDGLWDFVSSDRGCQACVPLSGTVHYGGPGAWGASFTREVQLALSGELLVVDMNADGYDDLLVTANDGTVQYWPGSPAGLTGPSVP